MEKNLIKQHLQSTRTRLYGIIDGAAAAGLVKRMYETGARNYCLLRGDLTDDVVHLAPYVVHLSSRNDISDWIFENGFGNNWGVFAQSRYSITEMRRHFRSLINVHNENGDPLIFRYYDPRVLRTYLPTCNAEELEAFFGNVDAYFAESESGEEIFKYEVRDGELVTTTLGEE